MAESSDYVFELPLDDEKALIANLKRRLEVGKKARPDGRSRLHVAFMLGHQWVSWDDSANKLRRATTSTGSRQPPVVKISVNKIGELVERRIARMTKSAPTPGVRPASPTPDDRGAAEVGGKILTHEFDRLDFQSKLVEALFWAEPVGWSYFHPAWDPDAGPKVASLSPPQEGSDEADFFVQMLDRLQRGRNGSGSDGGGIDLYKGDLTIDVVPHFEMVVDPGARYLEEARWCIRTVCMTREDVYERWNKKVKAQGDVSSFADEIRQLSDPGGGTSDSKVEDQVEVHQFWHVPNTRLCPKGIVFTWTGDDDVLETIDPWPYEFLDRLPFVELDVLPGMGTREGRTWMGDVIPMQKDRNDATSRIATYRRMMSPKLLAVKNAFDRRNVGSRVDLLEYRDLGNPPSWLDPGIRWMEPHLKSIEMRDAEMASRAGSGDVPDISPGVTAAAAIMALQEQDDTKLALTAKEIAKSIEKVGHQALMIIKEKWDRERVVRTWSADGSPEVDEFSGSDIAEQLDVHISAESLLPRSKSAMIAMAQFLVENQLVQDPSVILKTLTLPGIDEVTEFLSEDAQQQKREIDKMMDGLPQPVEYWHNHAEHLKELYSWMKTVDFEDQDHAIQELAKQHAVLHENSARGGQIPAPGTEGPQAQPDNMNIAALAQGGGALAPDPMGAAAGQTPPTTEVSPGGVGQIAGIGGPGQQGRVPGVSPEQQASLTGM